MTFALIRLNGRLQFCDGIPGRTNKEADSGPTACATFTIQRAAWGGHGLRGHVSDARGPVGAPAPNPVATALVSALGGTDQSILGNLAIGGDRIEPCFDKPVPCGLTEAQQHLIRDVHAGVRRSPASSPGVEPQGVDAYARAAVPRS